MERAGRVITYSSPLTQQAADAYNEIWRLRDSNAPEWMMVEPLNQLRLIVCQLEQEIYDEQAKTTLGLLLERHPQVEELEKLLALVNDEEFTKAVRQHTQKGVNYG